jgi:hypothetical protein
MKAYLALKFPTQSTEDEESARDVLEEFRNSKQPGAGDSIRDAQRLKEQIKIEKPEF